MRELSCWAHLFLTATWDHPGMSGTAPRPGYPVDPDLAGFDELVHRSVPAPVAVAYEEAGTSIAEISLIQSTWSPGRRLTTRYRVSGEGGGLNGRRDLVAVLGRIPEGAIVVEGPDTTVGLWFVPNDPLLPGLPSALDETIVADLLSDLGSSEEVVRSRLRSYRPGRRAVVEVEAGASSIFLKVVPPSEVDELHVKHRFLSDFLAVPDSLGVARDLGIVVMRALPGVDLRTTLRSGAKPVPDPVTIARMVEELPAPAVDWTVRSPIESLSHVVSLLESLLPDQAGRLVELGERIGEDPDGDLVPVHGDFHEAQILADGDRPIGLIDVDTFGWGRPGDDAATMLGHLHLLAPGCRVPSQVLDFARGLNQHWDARLDPVDLRLRTAAVVLGLATGPFRVNRPSWHPETMERIEVAEQWVESASRVDEKSLMPSSGRSHPTHA